MNKQIKNEFGKLNKKLDFMEESANLGTFDSTIIGIMVFILGTAISLLSIDSVKFLAIIPPLLVVFIYIMVFASFIIFLYQGYISSVLIKKGRFTTKSMCIASLKGMGVFIGLLAIILFIFWWYEKPPERILSSTLVQVSVFVIFGIALVYTFFEYHKMKKYFKDNFPLITKSREKEIDKEKKMLEKLKKIRNGADYIKELASPKSK